MKAFWSRIARELSPYLPGEQPRIANLVKLNTNESPFGPSPLALEAMRAAAVDTLRLYPDPEAQELREALAVRPHHGVRSCQRQPSSQSRLQRVWSQADKAPTMFTRSVPAMSAEITLEMWKWPFPWTSCISTRPVGNDFQKPCGNQGGRHFHMSTISAPYGGPACPGHGRPAQGVGAAVAMSSA
jgi:hypothetical protein